MKNIKLIHDLIEELEDREEARRLLTAIWEQMAPDFDKPIPLHLKNAMQKYFDFDDSE